MAIQSAGQIELENEINFVKFSGICLATCQITG
jgi:hypothetical protein